MILAKRYVPKPLFKKYSILCFILVILFVYILIKENDYKLAKYLENFENMHAKYLENFEKRHAKYSVNFEDVDVTITPRVACQNVHSFLTIVVLSSANNFERRSRIRETWGGVSTFQNKSISLFFILAKPPSELMQESIIKESETWHDILQFSNPDLYTNAVIKMLMAVEWLVSNCKCDFILKVDDDVFINAYFLIEVLINYGLSDDMYCAKFQLKEYLRPNRAYGNKWSVPYSVYPFDLYPPYCSGFAYLAKFDVMKKIVAVANKENVLWIEDVYISGILREHASIPLQLLTINSSETSSLNQHLIVSYTDIFFVFMNQKTNESELYMHNVWMLFWELIKRYHSS